VQAQKYAALKKPYLINDMVMQDVLLDRRKVYTKLQARTGCLIWFGQQIALNSLSLASGKRQSNLLQPVKQSMC
jgi:hypothetical protein